MNYIFQYTFKHKSHNLSFPDVSVVKNPTANAGDTGLFPELGRSPGGGNDNTLRYSYLENLMDRGAWQAIQFMGLQSTGLSD